MQLVSYEPTRVFSDDGVPFTRSKGNINVDLNEVAADVGLTESADVNGDATADFRMWDVDARIDAKFNHGGPYVSLW